MNHSLKKTISAIVAFIVSASCFSNMAFADTSLTITDVTTQDGKISAITVDGSSDSTGKGIVAVYTNTGSIKEIAFIDDEITKAGSFDLSKPLELDEGDTYKVFVWDSIENADQKPLFKSEVITK